MIASSQVLETSVPSIPLLISMTISWLLARSLSKPLLKIKDTATTFGNGDFTARVQQVSRRSDELGVLAKSFNTMAEKLEQGISAHQRLLADVSHELRSPMTRLQIALALANKSAENPKELEKHLLRCELEVTRLDDMIADVLTLSRLENTYQQILLADVDLHDLLQTIIDDAQYIANEKSIIIEQELTKPCYLFADSQLLASAMQNILTNAIKYSPENTMINVSLQQSIEQLEITIKDAGMGIPEHALPELFKPFYRVSDARERTTGGTGLGLAIAQQAVMAHQGTIKAENNHSGGLTITINLPLNISDIKQK
jgi:two-component system sensor histidine kinase CpxA